MLKASEILGLKFGVMYRDRDAVVDIECVYTYILLQVVARQGFHASHLDIGLLLSFPICPMVDCGPVP